MSNYLISLQAKAIKGVLSDEDIAYLKLKIKNQPEKMMFIIDILSYAVDKLGFIFFEDYAFGPYNSNIKAQCLRTLCLASHCRLDYVSSIRQIAFYSIEEESLDFFIDQARPTAILTLGRCAYLSRDRSIMIDLINLLMDSTEQEYIRNSAAKSILIGSGCNWIDTMVEKPNELHKYWENEKLMSIIREYKD